MRSGNGQEPKRFVYKARDAKAIEAVANQSTSRFVNLHFDEYPRYIIQAGVNRLRVLPPTWDGAAHYAYNLIVHSNVPPDDTRYLCLRMLSKKCPICEERIILARSGEAEAAKSLAPYDSRVSWVINRAKPEGPELWFFGVKMDRNVAMASIDDDGVPMLIDHPDEGYDINFRCENPGIHAQYSNERVARNPSPIHDNPRKQQDWLDYITNHPVPDTLQFFSYEKIKEGLYGSVSSAPEEESERIRSRPSLRDQAQDTEYDDDTGEVSNERNPPEQDRRPPPRQEVIPPEETSRRRLPPRDDEREDDPSNQARTGLRQLRPPSMRPSQRDR